MKGKLSIDAMIGEGIRKRRMLRGLTQGQLGKALGMSFQQVQKYEYGTNRVSAAVLLQLAELFCCSTDDLFGEAANWRKRQNKHSGHFPELQELLHRLNKIPSRDLRSALCRAVLVLVDCFEGY